MNTVTDQAAGNGRKPDGAWVVLHAAALVVLGALCNAISGVAAGIMGWLNVHAWGDTWVARSTSYNQRALNIIRPWWESTNRLACRRAERRDHHD